MIREELPSVIQVDALSIQAGKFRLSNISFEVPDGTYGILMGRTGSGKTTILEAICGLKKVVSGRIVLKGRDVTHLKPAERGIGFVPQDGGLFPTMTVRQQLGFALKVRKWSRPQIAARVSELAKLLGIGHLLERSLFGLSGGERQRIALGRALAAHPDVLCLDEPLSALDEATREEMYDLLKSVQKSTGVTALHITHSISEATRLGDNAFVLEDGGIIGGAAFAAGKSGRSLHDPPAMSVKIPNRDPLPPSGENSSVQEKETAANDRG